MKRFRWLFPMIMILITLGCGCAKKEQSILVVLGSESDELKMAAQQWADEKNLSIQVVAPKLSTVYGQQHVLENSIKEKNWDLIIIKPLGDTELSPILDYAQNQGTTVVAMQGNSKLTADYSIHPFSDKELGTSMMDALAQAMNMSGNYVTVVPAKESEIIMQQELSCIEKQKQSYQQMLPVSRLQASGSSQAAYDTADKLYDAYEMEGVLFFSYIDGLGLSQWIQNTKNNPALVGIGFPELMEEEIKNGSIDTLFYWNQENLLLASLEVGQKEVSGKQKDASDVITTGIDGYRTLRVTETGIYVGNDLSSISGK